MKNFLFTLSSAIVAMLVLDACSTPETETIMPDPNAHCWVFVSTIPGEETILLAKSGLSFDEGSVIFADFKSKYGDGNIWASISFPGGINDFGKSYLIDHPDAVTNCYEITRTVDFSKSSEPSLMELLEWGFRGIRIDGDIAICKEYIWAYTDEMAEESSQWRERSYYARYSGGGTIINNHITNLGPEIHNMPIEF